MKSNEQGDNDKVDLRKPIRPRGGEEDDINNMNNYTNYVQNIREKGPSDSGKNKKEINFKGSFQETNNNTNKEEKRSSKPTGPKDSERKDGDKKLNSNKKKLKQKKGESLNKNEMEEEIAYKNKEVNVNPISGLISNAILSQNDYTQQQDNNNEPYSQQEYKFVKKEIYSPSEEDYYIQQQYNQNDFITYNQGQQYYSPEYNDMNNIALNNNMQYLENYGNQGNVYVGPYSNVQVDINNDNINNQILTSQEQNYEYVDYQQNSQNEYDMTMSDRDNPLIYSDDKGNMNYLERQYAEYQSRMNQNDDY